MNENLHAEARALIASARELIDEFVEEGIDRYVPNERTETLPTPAAPGPGLATTSDAASPPERTAPERLPRPADRQGPRRGAPPPGDVTRSVAPAPTVPEGPIVWEGKPTLQFVRERLGECTRCGLCQGRSTIVFGDGNPEADLMFIGEGPGEQEDRSGLPFVGRAGELLTTMIEKGLQIPRSSVYICNIVKCRPPNNRTPLADEVAACRPFLDGQIAAVQPKVIVALGKPAASLLLGRDVAITRVRGIWQEYLGIPVMPTFHPAFVLRQYTQENRRLVWEDLKAARARCDE